MHVKKARSTRHGERGQALVLFVGVFTIIALAGAIAVDAGLWLSERRGASRDADLVSLAGVYELLDNSSLCAGVPGAVDDWATLNDLDPADDVHNLACKALAFPDGFEDDEGYCEEAPDTGERPNAVALDIDHESRALFASIIGVDVPDIGAHACARAGSLLSTSGLRPWSVPRTTSVCFGPDVDDFDGDGDTTERVPLFGATCVFRLESPSSQVGSLRLGSDEEDPCSGGQGSNGASVYRDNVVGGSPAECTIGDIAETQPGLDTGPTLAALEDLLANEGECDGQNGTPPNGIDEFAESFVPTSGIPGPAVTFTDRDCSTPRAIHIIILNEFDGTGMDHEPILGFAAFFLEQCEELDGDVVIAVFPKCDMHGGGHSSFQVRGFFMSVLELEGDIGDFDEFGTKVIRLVE